MDPQVVLLLVTAPRSSERSCRPPATASRSPDPSAAAIFTIRTGPADWSHRLVTDCQRYLRRVQGGYLYRSGEMVPCPEERDFFRAIGQPWLEPEHRRADLVRIQAVSR